MVDGRQAARFLALGGVLIDVQEAIENKKKNNNNNDKKKKSFEK